MSLGSRQARSKVSPGTMVLALVISLLSILSCEVPQADTGDEVLARPGTSVPLVATTSGDEASATSPVEDASPSVDPVATLTTSEVETSAAHQPQTVRARIDIDVGERVGPVNELLFGNSVIAAGRGNGILDLDRRFNAQALQMIRELKPSILRFAGQPIFEDGIGDPRARPPARCGWEYWRTYEYGVDEHMALLEAIGAEGQAMFSIAYPYGLEDSADPASCVISSTSTSLGQVVRRAMAWVAYVNGDPADTTLIGLDDHGFDWQTVGHWAQQRVYNGHPEPYGVKYWDIGNESYNASRPVTPEEYGQVYAVFQSAMKRVDPSIVVGASAGLGPYAQTSWNAPLLSVIGPYVDALVLYAFYPNKIYHREFKLSAMAAATQASHDLAQVRRLLDTNTSRSREISLILGGMGISYDFAYEDTIPAPWNTLLVGLYDADLLGVLVENSEAYGLELGIRHWLHGEAPPCDIHFDWDTGERYKRQGYYALQMWTSHFGDVLVRNRVASDSFDVPATYGNVGPLYDVPCLAAHSSIAGDKLYLLVINRHLTDDMPTAIHIDGFIPQPEAAVYTLNGPELESTNEHGNHDTVVIVSSGFSQASNDFTYVFPAHSVTAIELQQTGKGH